jgi:transglutaminase-like putative cysteine protease
MRSKTLIRFVLALLVVPTVAATPGVASPTSVTGEHDIGALIRRAEKAFDLAREDAVFLLDSERDDWTADGRRIRSLHRIVYIRTGHAIRSLADLRVPYDASRQRITVTALRTWRLSDERWIESGPTAQVETLPFAIDHAPDYADRRDMMLLHDGVELPCVLETAYAIEDTEPFRAGAEGLRALARSHPTVVSRFILGLPAGAAPSYAASTDVPEPTRRRDGALGLDTFVFEMGPVEPSPYPQTPEALAHSPHIVWSTFKDWSSLGQDLHDRFTAAVELGDEVRRRLAEHLKQAGAEAEKARLVAGFVADSTRHVDDKSGWWPAPRSATRTWETAYGNRIDRTVLAAALYRGAGLEASLVFRAASFGDAEVRVPNLSWTEGPGLWIEGADLEGYFDPASAEFSNGPLAMSYRAIWRPAVDEAPSVRWGKGDALSKLAVRLDLHYDAENERWKGRGVLTATGALCPFEKMVGLAGEAQEYLGSVAGAVLDGAAINRYNPVAFDPSSVTVGFEIEAPVGEPDVLGRLKLKVADPGVLKQLLAHAAVGVHEESRGSGVVLPTAIEQRLELRLDIADLEVVRLPAASETANTAGRCVIAADETEGEVVLRRDLSLARKAYTPEEWPALRLLLLTDGHEGNRLVLLK